MEYWLTAFWIFELKIEFSIRYNVMVNIALFSNLNQATIEW